MKTVGVLFIFVAIVLLGGAFVLGATGVNLTPNNGKPKIVCDIQVTNPHNIPYVDDNMDIQSANCQVVGTCGFIDSFTITPLWFENTGQLIVESGGDQAKKSLFIAEGASQTFEMTVCSDLDRVIVTIKDDSNNIDDTREVLL